MGQVHHTPTVKPAARSSSRLCLRKGCGRVFQAVRWNQRFCREPGCLQEVRRWQAAKRQRVFRQSAENRQRQAEAEARRRRAKKEAAAAASFVPDPAQEASSSQPGPWSRSNKIPPDFCDRPGCYEPLPAASRSPARYCGGDCRQALRCVRDRERKWLLRHGDAPATRGYGQARAARRDDLGQKCRQNHSHSGGRTPGSQESSPGVGASRASGKRTLSFSPVHDPLSRRTDEDDDSQTGADGRSRSPPAG